MHRRRRCGGFPRSAGQRGQARRKAGGHGGDRNARAIQRRHGGFNHFVIDADRAGCDAGHIQCGQHLGVHWLAGLGAQAADAGGGVVAGQGGQVDAGHSLEQPCRLIVLFDRAAGGQCCRAAFDGRGVGLYRADPVHIQIHARIAGQGQLRQVRVLRCGGGLKHGVTFKGTRSENWHGRGSSARCGAASAFAQKLHKRGAGLAQMLWH